MKINWLNSENIFSTISISDNQLIKQWNIFFHWWISENANHWFYLWKFDLYRFREWRIHWFLNEIKAGHWFISWYIFTDLISDYFTDLGLESITGKFRQRRCANFRINTGLVLAAYRMQILAIKRHRISSAVGTLLVCYCDSTD